MVVFASISATDQRGGGVARRASSDVPGWLGACACRELLVVRLLCNHRYGGVSAAYLRIGHEAGAGERPRP